MKDLLLPLLHLAVTAAKLCRPGRIRKVAIGLRPSTLLTFHQALVRGKYRRLFSSHPLRGGHRVRARGLQPGAMREKKSYIGFLMILMQRLVTSSTCAIRTTLERRLEVLAAPRDRPA